MRRLHTRDLLPAPELRPPTLMRILFPTRPAILPAREPECSYCLGRGTIIGSFLIFWARVKTCPECNGSGNAEKREGTEP